MNEYSLSLKYFVYDIPNHKIHKKNILSLINKMPKSSYLRRDCKVYNTDWNLPKEIKREYADYFYKEIAKDYMNWFLEKYNLTNYEIHNIWYQQYLKNNFHSYHTHSGCNLTNIYFIEAPIKEMITDVIDLDNKKINLKCKEGQIISFPAFLLHRSNVNNTNLRKTIMSFNSSFVKD
jgi:cupin superfamily acireductone dioxygenase involved in methionine salvage